MKKSIFLMLALAACSQQMWAGNTINISVKNTSRHHNIIIPTPDAGTITISPGATKEFEGPRGYKYDIQAAKIVVTKGRQSTPSITKTGQKIFTEGAYEITAEPKDKTATIEITKPSTKPKAQPSYSYRSSYPSYGYGSDED